ncbi:unnamed protein product [Arctogadus glacialis]
MLLLAAVAMLLCYFTCRLAAAWHLGGPSGGFGKLGAQGEDMYRAHLVRSLKEIREKKNTLSGTMLKGGRAVVLYMKARLRFADVTAHGPRLLEV